MKLTIKEQVNPTNLFQVEVLFMHGDGDAYTTKTYDVGLVGTAAKAMLKFFTDCTKKYPQGMGGDDGYWAVPGYFDEGVSTEPDEEYGCYEEGLYDIPSSSEYCEGHAQVQTVELYYYNGSGVKHRVAYELD